MNKARTVSTDQKTEDKTSQLSTIHAFAHITEHKGIDDIT